MNCPSCKDNPVILNREQVEKHAEEYDKELDKDFNPNSVKDESFDDEPIPENLDELDPDYVDARDHLQGPHKDICGYCNKDLTTETCITKMINGVKYEFCSEECINDFMDALEFKDDEF